MDNEFDDEVEDKEIKKAKRNIVILMILAVLIILIPLYIIFKGPFGLMYLSALGCDIMNFIMSIFKR